MNIQLMLHLDSFHMFMLCVNTIIQLVALITNVISIRIIFLMDRHRVKRARLLMTNIAFSDIVLILLKLRFLVLPFIVADSPLLSHVIQSVTNCLNATTLYVTSIIMVVIACDRYYLITNVFDSPFDAISTKYLLWIVWTSSFVLSLPFAVTSDVYYFDYTNGSMMCINDQNYLVSLNTDDKFRQITRLLRFAVQFALPSALVAYFCAKIIFCLNNTQLMDKKWIITKRFVVVFAIFLIKNSAFHMKSTKNIVIEMLSARQTYSCYLNAEYYILYIIFNTSGSFTSLIYFWMSSEFRRLYKCYVNQWLFKSTNSGIITTDETTVKENQC
ncbi:unnamed protein product [Medioppia subpectinata]|uniref:G-protein coupled receptors family 1 profile domain-containing protein n=1 Tax=Medioppia subpectinata TaxID=1979941 RepID=A0A7R9L2V5_9ACAR|nr:unnamed protein product [Medioppia subpectinata]CAG2114552.1 unnamed protein product [Medioppia subpectinata]